LKLEDNALVFLTDREDAETLEMILPTTPERTTKHDKPVNNKSKPTTTDFFILTIKPFRESALKASANCHQAHAKEMLQVIERATINSLI
jgi:hypothetical protein